MIERLLFWIAILILSVAVIGLKIDLSKLEQKAKETSSYTVSSEDEGGEEE
ncbi:hypothetical protein PERMA_0655 [Persephonella marina EX-H1]|uniref:Uncharacterized protein n=2 Tax=Hydrogenothermaceae TaxID=224027 RepID=C0QUS9_PERMH|nr:hypothetical protein PERMA_0655 [Persephonella marina EX-H1]